MSSQELRSSQSSMSDKSEDHTNQRPASGLFANASIVSFENVMPAEDCVEAEKRATAQPSDPAACPSGANSVDSIEDSSAAAEDTQPEVPSLAQAQDVPTSIEPLVVEKTQVSKKPPNKPRLRMSLEGKAEIVIDKNTPSPPSKTSTQQQEQTARSTPSATTAYPPHKATAHESRTGRSQSIQDRTSPTP